jgi:hypothetical protein
MDLMGHVTVWFEIRYALSVVRLGDFRSVSSSFFHTYVIAVCSYETDFKQNCILSSGHTGLASALIFGGELERGLKRIQITSDLTFNR